MSFSATWLALREPADHRSRDAALAGRLQAHVGDKTLRVVDLGSGTGSNLRATAPLLGDEQAWTLVDYDPALLEAASLALADWADEARAEGEVLALLKDGRRITVSFRVADLNRDLDAVLAGGPDLVTASALFDLISEAWMRRFAARLAQSGAAFYTVLTYDGRDGFAPSHAQDAAVIAAFAAHQRSDKGFGPAAGPLAAAALADALRAAGYRVETGDSPWRLGPEDAALVGELLDGIAGAVAETKRLAPAALEEWLAFRQSSRTAPEALLTVGHTDILAVRS